MEEHYYQIHIASFVAETLSKHLCQNHSMDVIMLPNRTFTNPLQLIQTSSTDERARNRFLVF